MINKISKYNISHYNTLDNNNNNNNLDNNLHTNYDDILFVFFLLSILLNINLISKYKYNKANYKYIYSLLYYIYILISNLYLIVLIIKKIQIIYHHN